MKCFIAAFFVLLIRLSTACATAVATGMPVDHVDCTTESGITIEVRQYFDNVPLSGGIPVQVYIHNRSKRSRTWQVNCRDRQYGSRNPYSTVYQTALTVEAGSSGEFDFVIPTLNSPGINRYLTVNVFGHGVENGYVTINNKNEYAGKGYSPFVAMSEGLAIKNWGLLDARYKKLDKGLVGANFDVTFLPSDYRAWTGFSSVWMKDVEWVGLSANVRQGLRDWVATGGTLYLSGASATSKQMDASAFGAHGFGKIRYLQLAETDEAAELIHKELDTLPDWKESHRNHRSHSKNLGKGWGLYEKMDAIPVQTALILIFVVLFAIGIGPLNFMYHQRKRKLVRLFIFTPLFSLAAGLILIGSVLLLDGTGGDGRRFQFSILLPDEHKIITVQEQAARCGLLLSRKFTPPAKGVMLPLATGGPHNTLNRNLSMADTVYDKDWFLSRAVVGHSLSQIESSRMRVEVWREGAEGAPFALSSIPGRLKTFFYRDPRGRLWKSEGLRTGEKGQLVAAESKEFHGWFRNLKEVSHPQARLRKGNISKRSSYFYAELADPAELMIDSLSSIDWHDDRALFMGPCVEREGGKQ